MDSVYYIEVMKRISKYLLIGFIVSIAVYAIPKTRVKCDEIILIGVIAAATFSIIDTYLPTSILSI